MYSSTIVNFGHTIDVALDIAMNYLERTGQATAYWDTHLLLGEERKSDFGDVRAAVDPSRTLGRSVLDPLAAMC
jgi:hypothetical protein